MRALVLPGLDGTGLLLAPFAEALNPGIDAHVVAYPPDVAMDYGALATYVEERLPSESILLIAESFSGPVAIRLAARLPARFAGLVLCATFAKSPSRWMKPLRQLLALPLPIPPAGWIAAVGMGRWTSQDWKNRIERVMGTLRPKVVRHRLSAVLAVDASADLRCLRSPILYLQPSEDRLVPATAWLDIASTARDARLQRIEGPHFLLQANPKAAADAVRAFARDVGNTPQP